MATDPMTADAIKLASDVLADLRHDIRGGRISKQVTDCADALQALLTHAQAQDAELARLRAPLGDDGEVVERLREEALSGQQVAWGRIDGGQEYALSAMLADQAADFIERQAATLAEMRAAIEAMSGDYQTSEHHHPGWVLIRAEVFECLRALEDRALAGSATTPGGM